MNTEQIPNAILGLVEQAHTVCVRAYRVDGRIEYKAIVKSIDGGVWKDQTYISGDLIGLYGEMSRHFKTAKPKETYEELV